jgi:hypothetical protein
MTSLNDRIQRLEKVLDKDDGPSVIGVPIEVRFIDGEIYEDEEGNRGTLEELHTRHGTHLKSNDIPGTFYPAVHKTGVILIYDLPPIQPE